MSSISEVFSTSTQQAPVARNAKVADSDGDGDGSTASAPGPAPVAQVSRPTDTMGNNVDVFA